MSSDSSSDDEFILDVMEILPRERQLRIREQPMMTMNDIEFKMKYRFSKHVMRRILDNIIHALQLNDNRNNPIEPMNQLLIAVRFYATGSMQNLLADHMKVLTASVCRIIKRVTVAIAGLSGQFIKMPETREEISLAKEKFYKIALTSGYSLVEII